MEAVGFRVYFDDGDNRVEWPGFIKYSAHVDLTAAQPLSADVGNESNIITVKRIAAEPAQIDFWSWGRTVDGSFVRKDLTIELHDGHEPIATYTIRNAWPTKYIGPSLNATGNEVAIESLELAHEGVSLR